MSKSKKDIFKSNACKTIFESVVFYIIRTSGQILGFCGGGELGGSSLYDSFQINTKYTG